MEPTRAFQPVLQPSFLCWFVILQGSRMTGGDLGSPVRFGRTETKHPSGCELAAVAQPSKCLWALAPPKTRHFVNSAWAGKSLFVFPEAGDQML